MTCKPAAKYTLSRGRIINDLCFFFFTFLVGFYAMFFVVVVVLLDNFTHNRRRHLLGYFFGLVHASRAWDLDTSSDIWPQNGSRPFSAERLFSKPIFFARFFCPFALDGRFFVFYFVCRNGV